MNVIGVIDLAGGRAVHARAGPRRSYQPIRQVAGIPVPDADPLVVADIYLDRLGVEQLYVADLDAIAGGGVQEETIRRLAARAPLWLDAATPSALAALGASALGARMIVMGLETLPSFDALEDAGNAIGGDRLAFSLDLRQGLPVAPLWPTPMTAAAEDVAEEAVRRGIGTLLVLDLARVGTGSGPDLPLFERLCRRLPRAHVLAGGGIRGAEDLRLLAAAGCQGALVATALHDGRLDREALHPGDPEG